MMNNLLTEKDEYNIGIITNIIQKSFQYIDNNYDPDCIYVDIDSAISILTGSMYDTIKDNNAAITMVIKNAVVNIANFINDWKNRTKIKLYYSLKPTKKFNEYIPTWNEERNKRLSPEILKLLSTQIIKRLNKLVLANIDIIECDDSPILYIAKDIKLNTDKGAGTVIISRDTHYQCLFSFLPHIELYDGKKTITKEDFRNTKGYPNINYILVPYHYALAGNARNEYKKPEDLSWGTVKINNYLTANGHRLAEDELINKHMNAVKVFKIIELL